MNSRIFHVDYIAKIRFELFIAILEKNEKFPTQTYASVSFAVLVDFCRLQYHEEFARHQERYLPVARVVIAILTVIEI